MYRLHDIPNTLNRMINRSKFALSVTVGYTDKPNVISVDATSRGTEHSKLLCSLYFVLRLLVEAGK